MSALGGLIRYLRDKPPKDGWLPKDKWIDKMKSEGKWKNKNK